MFSEAQSIALKLRLDEMQERGKHRISDLAIGLNADCAEARRLADAGLADGLLTQEDRDLVYARSGFGMALAGLVARAGACESAQVPAWTAALAACGIGE